MNGFVKIVGNGENTGYQHFLLFPQCFPPILRISALGYIYLIICKCFKFIPVEKLVSWLHEFKDNELKLDTNFILFGRDADRWMDGYFSALCPFQLDFSRCRMME